VGVAPGKVRVHLHQVEQLGDSLVDLLAAGRAERHQRLADNVTHRHARVQTGIRVLEDHLHLAPHEAHGLRAQVDQVLSSEVHIPRRGLIKLQNGAAGGRLAAARFTHQAERFAAVDIKRHAIYRVHGADLAADDPAIDGKMHHQVFDAHQGFVMIGHARSLPVFVFTQQAMRWPGAIVSNTGFSFQQRSIENVQRGAKGQECGFL